jgi:uncharacterized membrane protein
LIVLWPDEPAATEGAALRELDGTVTSIQDVPCPPPAPETPPGLVPTACGVVIVRLDAPNNGEREVTAPIPQRGGEVTVASGDEVVLGYTPDAVSGNEYQVVDHQRGDGLLVVVLAGALAVVAFGRLRGIAALVGLGVSFAVLLKFIVPAILGGSSPVLVAVVGAAAIALLVLYLTHGVSVRTSVAVVGTLASLTLTGLLAALATGLAELTGIVGEDAGYLNTIFRGVDMRGLLLAGIVIGSLGVLDDVCTTQVAAVAELAGAKPDAGRMTLYRAAARVGRTHIASVVNTLVLAYAGASLPLLLLIATSNRPLHRILTNELIAQEIVRSAVGMLGLVAAVPITTALATLVLTRDRPAGTPRTGDTQGSRSERASEGEHMSAEPASDAEAVAVADTAAEADHDSRRSLDPGPDERG